MNIFKNTFKSLYRLLVLFIIFGGVFFVDIKQFVQNILSFIICIFIILWELKIAIALMAIIVTIFN